MLTKYANHEAILEIKTASERMPVDHEEGAMLAKFAKTKSEPEVEGGYVYVRTRAISSRVNKNNDGWPSEELAKAYKTFVGRPVFVDHNNSDPKRTRGVIVDAKLHVDDEKTSALDPYYSSAPDNHKPPTWVELLIEVDGHTFPKLAEAIKKGDVDSTSMGANIEKSVCSVCGNEAAVPSDYCSHIKSKGSTFEITADNGEKVQKKAYEDCYGVNFFEDSFVFDPADETALNIGVDETHQPLAKVAAEFHDDYDIDQYDHLKDHVCPKCEQGTVTISGDAAECPNCGWYGSPEDLIPATSKSKGYGKTAFFGVPNQNVFNWLSGVGIVAAYGKPYVDALVHRLANGEPPAEVFADLDPDIRAKIEEQLAAGNLQNLHPYDHEKEASTKEALDPSIYPHIPGLYDWQALTIGLAALGLAAGKIRQVVQALKEGAQPEEVLGAVPGAQEVIQDAKQKDQPYDQERESKTADLKDIEDRELNHEPQGDQTTAPAKVDTLRDDIKCPNCGVDVLDADPDGILRCPTCQYEQPPEGLDNPDLDMAQNVDKDKTLGDDEDGGEVIRATDEDADDQDFIKPFTNQETKASATEWNFDSASGTYQKGDLRIVAANNGYFVAKGWYGPDANYIAGPFKTPEEAMNRLGATNSNVPTGVISEMKWETKIATNDAAEANQALSRVTSAVIQTTIGYHSGVHFPTHGAFQKEGLHAVLTYPDGTKLEVPGNPVAHMMQSKANVEGSGLTHPGEIPVTVEADDSQIERVLELLHTGGFGTQVEGAVKEAASFEMPYPGGQGIHNGTSLGFTHSGVTAVVTIPGAPMPLHLPFAQANAGVMMAMFKMQGLVGEGKPIHVESENPEAAKYLIEANAHVAGLDDVKTWPPATTAATKDVKTPTKKDVVLPQGTRKGDEPQNERVVDDQLAPVTSDRRVIKREESPDGHRTEQIVEETGDLLAEDPPKDEKKDDSTDEGKVDTEQPRSQKERTDGEEEESDGKPDYLKKKEPVAAAVDNSEKLLAALAVAEQAVEMKVIEPSKKMAFVGQLENESFEEIEARRRTLALVKSAGLTNRKVASTRHTSSLPRLSYTPSTSQNGNGNLDDIPFESVFLT